MPREGTSRWNTDKPVLPHQPPHTTEERRAQEVDTAVEYRPRTPSTPVAPRRNRSSIYTAEELAIIEEMEAMADDDDHMNVDEPSPPTSPTRPQGGGDRPEQTGFMLPRPPSIPLFHDPRRTPLFRPTPVRPYQHREEQRPMTAQREERQARPNFGEPPFYSHPQHNERNHQLSRPRLSHEGWPTRPETPSSHPRDEISEEQLNKPMPAIDRPAPTRRDADYPKPPQGGWRDIQGTSPFWRTENLKKSQRRAWEEDTADYAVFYQDLEHGACDFGAEGRARMAEQLTRTVIDGVIGIQRAEAEIPTHIRNRPPYYNRMKVRTKKDRDTLLNMKYLSGPGITIQFETPAPELPMHIATFQNAHCFEFGLPLNAAPKALEDAVTKVLRKVVEQDDMRKAIMEEVKEDNATNPPGRWRHLSPRQAYEVIRKSIHAHCMRRDLADGGYETLVAVYMESPTSDPGRWVAFRNFMRNIPFGSDAAGRPTIYKGETKCAICHTSDHETNGCYLGTTEFWSGPRPNRMKEKAEVPRGEGSQRGRGGPARGGPKRTDYRNENRGNPREWRTRQGKW